MALVPWTYNNPRVSTNLMDKRSFSFRGGIVEVFQDTSADIGLQKNTELKLWDGAYYLARYFEEMDLRTPGFWRGKRCIELGAGCGLVGLVAWLLGAEVTLTDLPSALPHTQRVVEHNVVRLAAENCHLDSAKISVIPYSWGEDCSELSPLYDVILGSDIVYNPEVSHLLCKGLNDLSGGSKSTVIFSYKRRGLGEENFFDEAERTFSSSVETFEPAEFLNSEYRIITMNPKPDGLS